MRTLTLQRCVGGLGGGEEGEGGGRKPSVDLTSGMQGEVWDEHRVNLCFYI
jgi:hypothetical protein